MLKSKQAVITEAEDTIQAGSENEKKSFSKEAEKKNLSVNSAT